MYAINNVYEKILKFAGAYPDKDGYIFQKFRGKEFPFVIDEKSVVMPYDNHLANPTNKLIFHPLMESHVRGESEITSKLRKWINVRINFTTAIIAQSLIRLCASPELHKRLKPEQAELLLKVREADSLSETNFIKLMTAGCKTDPDSYYVNIYPRRGGDYQKKRYACVGVVVFPFYLNLIDDKVDKIRVKDKATFKEILEFMFPDIADREAYNYGSQSMVAKFMDALMMTAGNVATRLNELLHLYRDYIEDVEDLFFSEEWTEYFEKLDDLVPEIRRIPMQEGNEGSLLVQPQVQQTTTPAAGPVNVPQMLQPQIQQPQQMVQQQPTTASGKLDFRSIMQSNPAIAFAPNPLANTLMQQQMQQQFQQPQMPPAWTNLAAPAQMPQGMQPQMMQGMQPQVLQQTGQYPIVQTTMGFCYQLPNGQLVPVPQQQMMQPQLLQPQMQQPSAPGWGDLKNLIKP